MELLSSRLNFSQAAEDVPDSLLQQAHDASRAALTPEQVAKILPLHPNARQLRMRYVKVLNEQSRFVEAKAIADTVQNQDKMGPFGLLFA